MQIQFIRNIQFTKLLKANGRLREFNFRKANALKEGLVTVDVCDDRGNRLIFQMQKEQDFWKVQSPDLPAWIIDTVPKLNELIEEELRGI